MGNLSEIELKALAEQLSNPKGEAGVLTGHSMNIANDNMIRHAIDAIDIQPQSTILEIGPGNGKHISYLFGIESSIQYYGADISDTMVQEANMLNADLVQNQKAVFQVSDGEKLDYPDLFFNTVFTVNTIYFWKDPKTYLQEISKILMSKGALIIAFIPEYIMQNIPFSKFGFTLYSEAKIILLLQDQDFTIEKVFSIEEEVLSNTGAIKNRTFTVIKAAKP